jgi:hypothetical protein
VVIINYILMSKLISTHNNNLSICDAINHSREFREEDNFLKERTFPKNLKNESKQEYDFKDHEVAEIEKLTNSKIICDIGYGGFSTVKLIFNFQQKQYFAMKVVFFYNSH